MVIYLEAHSLDSRESRFAFWSRISRTIAPVLAVLLALPLVFGLLRASGAGTRVALGLILGIGFVMMQRMLERGAVVFEGNPALFAWLPTALMGAAALWLIYRTR